MLTDQNPQPLDVVLTQLELNNDHLVMVSTEQLTHKQVQKARKGKRVTSSIQAKITRALNAAIGEAKYTRKDLFNVSSI